MTDALIARSCRRMLAGAATLLMAGACGDDLKGPLEDGATEVLSTLIVSNVVESATSGVASASPAAGYVFVSLSPGSVSSGTTAVIETRSTGAQVTVPMVDGGFDPIAITAASGDTLDIRIEVAGGGAQLRFHSVVPLILAPMIVRTEPPPRKRDVPLNAVMRVVFSEPIDAATLTTSSVRLLLDGAPVNGTLQVGDGMNLTATFTPGELLAPGSDYSLLITSAIEDLDGDALEEELRVDFSTAAPSAAGALAVVSGDQQPGKAGRELPDPLVVRVTDAAGVGVPGVEVTWRVTYGEGAFDDLWVPCIGSPEDVLMPLRTLSVRTGADGLAQVSFVPTSFGPVTVRASVASAAVDFTTDASDAGATLEIVTGHGEAHDTWVWADFGWTLQPPFVVTVKDGEGNPVPNVAVEWSVDTAGGLLHACGWTLPYQRSVHTSRDGSGRSSVRFQPTLGPNRVTASVPGIEGSITFDANAAVALIWVDAGAHGVFRVPDGTDNAHVVVPVGTKVEFSVLAPAAHIVSIDVPNGGWAFDSGLLGQNGLYYDPAAEPLFGFRPLVAGTWRFVDRISGATGTVTAK